MQRLATIWFGLLALFQQRRQLVYEATTANSLALVRRRELSQAKQRANELQAVSDSLREHLLDRDAQIGQLESKVALLEAEVEFLTLWREKELQRLDTEAAILSSQRARALGDAINRQDEDYNG